MLDKKAYNKLYFVNVISRRRQGLEPIPMPKKMPQERACKASAVAREKRRLQKKKEYNAYYKSILRYRGNAATDERKTYHKLKILPTDNAAMVEDKIRHNALVEAIYERRRKQASHKPLTFREARAAAADVPEETRKRVIELLYTCGPDEIYEATGVPPQIVWHFKELRDKGEW